MLLAFIVCAEGSLLFALRALGWPVPALINLAPLLVLCSNALAARTGGHLWIDLVSPWESLITDSIAPFPTMDGGR